MSCCGFACLHRQQNSIATDLLRNLGNSLYHLLVFRRFQHESFFATRLLSLKEEVPVQEEAKEVQKRSVTRVSLVEEEEEEKFVRWRTSRHAISNARV